MPPSITKQHIRIVAISAGVLILIGIAGAITSAYVQRWLRYKGVELLEAKLGTPVRIDGVDVSLMGREVVLYGIELEDRRLEKMLSIDTLGAKIGLLPLFDDKLTIKDLRCLGVTAFLYKERKDTAANYQFVIDALRNKKPADGDKDAGRKSSPLDLDVRTAVFDRVRLRWDVYSEPVKGGDTLDANHFCIENVHFRIEEIRRKHKDLTVSVSGLKGREAKSKITLSAGNIGYRSIQDSNVAVNIERMQCSFGDKRIACVALSTTQCGNHLSLDRPMALRIDSMTYYRNNGKPHKRTGKPHRGWFDTGHIDAILNVSADMEYITKDSIKAKVTRMSAHDRASGLYIKEMTTLLSSVRDTITLRDMSLNLRQTAIKAQKAEVQLLKDKGGKTVDLLVKPFTLKAKVCLRDISKPFAPVLSDFTTPLHLSVVTGGRLNDLTFSDIRIHTTDKRLRLTASGVMYDVMKRKELRLHFNNIHLDARRGIKEEIIHHFSKKIRMKMGKQIRRIGDIRYHGRMGVYFKREDFSGTLFTKHGNADFDFVIDNRTKYMTGSISTDSLGLGSVMGIKKLGSIKAGATYSFNVASKSKRPVKHNGRLPIGWMKARIDSARYKGVNIFNVSATVHSDGATATGEVLLPKKLFDISLMFRYTQTDSVQDLKLKPRLLKHKKTSGMQTGQKKWKDYMKEARKRTKARKRKGGKTKEA